MILSALIFGAFGFLMENILTKPGEFLAWFRKLIERITGKNEEEQNLFQYWLHKISVKCGKCIAGNIGLWFYLLELDFKSAFNCTVLSILIAFLLNLMYERI